MGFEPVTSCFDLMALTTGLLRQLMSYLLNRYGQEADMWAFGMTILELAYGQAPLEHLNFEGLVCHTLFEEPPRLQRNWQGHNFSKVNN